MSSVQLSEQDLETAIAALTDAEHIKEARKAAESEAGKLTTEDWHTLRKLAKSNLYFLASTILGYNKLSPDLHGHFCAWLVKNDNEQFRETLLPRGHFKSTIQTISDSIRVALPDDAGDAPWPRCLGTNVRLLIGHEVQDSAARFLFSITSHFLNNPLLMGLFPECVPDPKKHRVNKNELQLPRSEIWSEPTFDTMGVGGRGQGRHYNFLKLDDLFGDKARDSEAERRVTYDWFDNIQSFFSDFAKDRLDLIGTRWAFDDLYSHAHEMYGDLLKKYIRSCEEQGKPIFPEMFPATRLTVLKKNQKVWMAQYVNNPEEGGARFERAWKRFYIWLGDNIIGIPTRAFGAGGDPRLERVNVKECDICILIDPAMNGLGGYIITAMDRRGRVFILKAKKAVWRPPELVNEIFQDVIKWKPRTVVIEAVLFSEVFHHWIVREQAFRNIRFKIEPAKTRNKTKDSRIEGLSNFFSASQIYFEETQQELIDEFDTFGASSQIHILDALAYGPEFWKLPASLQQQQQQEVSNRDSQTGYSL